MRVRLIGRCLAVAPARWGACSSRCSRWGSRSRRTAGTRLPLTMRGSADLLPIEYRLPVASAQIKSAVLIAGLHAPGATTVIEAEATRDHTERMLRHFGAAGDALPKRDGSRRHHGQGRRRARGPHRQRAGRSQLRRLPGGAALIVPGSEIAIEGVLVNPTRTGFYVTLREMGADIAFQQRARGGRRAGGRHRACDTPSSRACACRPSARPA